MDSVILHSNSGSLFAVLLFLQDGSPPPIYASATTPSHGQYLEFFAQPTLRKSSAYSQSFSYACQTGDLTLLLGNLKSSLTIYCLAPRNLAPSVSAENKLCCQ